MQQSNARRADSDQPEAQETQRGRPPVDKFHKGQIHVSIWKNESAKGDFHSATFELRYKDKNDSDPKAGWKTGRSYSASALKDLEEVAKLAREKIETLDKSRDQGSSQR